VRGVEIIHLQHGVWASISRRNATSDFSTYTYSCRIDPFPRGAFRVKR
jgi:hypothetical protein